MNTKISKCKTLFKGGLSSDLIWEILHIKMWCPFVKSSPRSSLCSCFFLIAKMQFSLLSLALFAGAAIASPVTLETSQLQARDNCTSYTSVSAGSVCYHTPSDCSFLFPPPLLSSLANRFLQALRHIWYKQTIPARLSWPNTVPSHIPSSFTGIRKFGLLIVLEKLSWPFFLSDVGQTCFGLRAFVPVCVDTPWYTFVPPVQPADGTVESATKIPVPVMPSIVSSCTTYELVGAGQTVDSMVAANNLTLDNFLTWNAYIDPTNPVAWGGYWVCVGAWSIHYRCTKRT